MQKMSEEIKQLKSLCEQKDYQCEEMKLLNEELEKKNVELIGHIDNQSSQQQFQF